MAPLENGAATTAHFSQQYELGMSTLKPTHPGVLRQLLAHAAALVVLTVASVLKGQS